MKVIELYNQLVMKSEFWTDEFAIRLKYEDFTGKATQEYCRNNIQEYLELLRDYTNCIPGYTQIINFNTITHINKLKDILQEFEFLFDEYREYSDKNIKQWKTKGVFPEGLTQVIGIIGVVNTHFKQLIKEFDTYCPPRPENCNTTHEKLNLNDFFVKTIDNKIIEKIKAEFASYSGKRMAIVVYLLQTEFKIIELHANSHTQSRKHFIKALTSKENLNTSYIDRILPSDGKNIELRENKTTATIIDKDYTDIKTKIENILK